MSNFFGKKNIIDRPKLRYFKTFLYLCTEISNCRPLFDAPLGTITDILHTMKRLLLTTALILAFGAAAHAQFTEGTKYIATSVSGLNMSYSKSSEFKLGLNAEGGYYFTDAWMARANFNYNHAKTLDGFALGAGVRYSFLQNGIFIGAGLEYAFDKYTTSHATLTQIYSTNVTKTPQLDADGMPVIVDGAPVLIENVELVPHDVWTTANFEERVSNFRIPVEIGYTFYLNHYLAVEPAVYSKMSLNHFSEGSEFGLKVGLGFYFDRLFNLKRSYRPFNPYRF